MNRIENFSQKFWSFISGEERWKSLLFVFTGAFILRAHTLFIDFIHVDVVTSYVLVKRDLAGLDFSPNKGWLNHYLMKWSIELFGDSVTSFHLTGIIFILLTMCFIIMLGRRIYSLSAGIIAAMLYGFIISSYNTEFTATNGEVLYNLFFMGTFYFSYLAFVERKLWIFPLALVSVFLGYMIKVQGAFSLPAVIVYLLFVFPLYRSWFKITPLRYYAILFASCGALLVVVLIDWNFTQLIFSGPFRSEIKPLVQYVANRGFNPLMVMGKLMLRAVHFLLYHSIIWVPGTLAIISFFRKRKRAESEGFIVAVTLALFASIFLGGARLSVHYFIMLLPTLSILSAGYIENRFSEPLFAKRAFLVFIIPVLFFFSWNVKDACVKNFAPELKQEEGKFAYYFRMIALASHGEYLLPHKSIVPVINYLKSNTEPDATIMSWPMGTEVVYYSGRHSAGYSYWLNEKALYAIVQREKGNLPVYEKYQKKLIRKIRKLNPDYFVDVGSTSMIRKVLIYRKKTDPPYYFDWNTAPVVRFGSFATLDDFPEVIDYLNGNYTLAGKFGEGRIWVRKK
ncbi:MAG TPA: glycosyltransferase family 39 protein [Spirochaetota bacterium]|nr:glycosyltransferase family 39 protein [Spirochaetota bacterium]